MYNAEQKAWSKEVLEAYGLPEKIFQPVQPTGKVLGTLSESIQKELMIQPAKVISVCGHDTQSAQVAVPATEEDFLFLSCGTWSLFGTELNAPLMNEEAFAHNITNEQGYGGKTSFLKNIIGLWLIQESRRQWIREGKEYSFGELEIMANEAEPFVSFIDPDAPEFVPEGNIPEALRQVSTLPYRESDGFILLYFSDNASIFCGVGALHLDGNILPQQKPLFNGGFSQ